ncbi:MAG: nitrilase-related carbon-nitrogen hydrolase [Xanthomonadales bacterium]|nr:nitrilase-related carbon-nitrogen hydrolase [Xanthomonadales bacterium]
MQYRQEPVPGLDALAARLEAAARLAAEAGAELMLLPELFTLQLLSAVPGLPRDRALELLTASSDALAALFRELARRHRLWLVGGSHLQDTPAGVRNRCLVAAPDGRLFAQDKLHLTPEERERWGAGGGDRLACFDAGFARFGVLICYDCEFPEAARALAEADCRLLLVPFATEDRAGYLRVRLCAAARAVENQCYVALAGNVGRLEGVAGFEQHYARSAVLAPSDLGFPPEGVLAEAEPGEARVLVAELDWALLERARRGGTVRQLADRRRDLFPPPLPAPLAATMEL